MTSYNPIAFELWLAESPEHKREITCDACDGWGETECCECRTEIECTACHGTGSVWDPRAREIYDEQVRSDRKRWETAQGGPG